ncbi:BppU family phage baseplate upper protein, partial [Bacillus wiedmannii]
DGVFEYTVSKEAVSSAGVWVGYFAFEKGTERFTTQDIRISLGNDVKQGNIPIENYIAEFDKLKKQIDALQLAVDKADVVKRSGDTITGDINMSGGKSINFTTSQSGRSYNLYVNQSNNNIYIYDNVGNTRVFGYDPATKTFDVPVNTNLLKKTGDTMSGNLTLDRTGTASRDILWSKDGVAQTNLGMNSANKLRLYDNVNALTVFEHDTATKTFSILADFKTKNDTDWIPLTLLNGVKQQSSQPASAVKRSGNVVNIVCAITDFKDKQVIANVPAIFRPDREMLLTPNYFQGLALKTGYVIVKPNGDIYLEGIEATVSLYRFALTYIV